MIKDGKTELLFKFIVQTVMRFSHTICPDDFTVCRPSSAEIHIRRARMGFEFKLPNHLGLDVELQIKNEVLVIKNATFTYSHKGDHPWRLAGGFIKPPGGLERDGSTFDKPFPERSVVANFTHDRELGLRLTGKLGGGWRYGVSVGRPRQGGQDAADPKDVKPPPAGIEVDDLTLDPGIWNISTRIAWAERDDFSIGAAGGVRFPGELTLGEGIGEPYEAKLFQPRPSKGIQHYATADVSAVVPHARIMAEGGYWRQGEAVDLSTFDPSNPALVPDLVGSHQMTVAGYVSFGISPSGTYGKAIDMAPLLHGWEIITRVEALTGHPGEDGGRGNMIGVTSGLTYVPSPQLLLQTDFGYQHFSAHLDPSTNRQQRLWLEIWAQVRL